jgi:hypothetical protein
MSRIEPSGVHGRLLAALSESVCSNDDPAIVNTRRSFDLGIVNLAVYSPCAISYLGQRRTRRSCIHRHSLVAPIYQCICRHNSCGRTRFSASPCHGGSRYLAGGICTSPTPRLPVQRCTIWIPIVCDVESACTMRSALFILTANTRAGDGVDCKGAGSR